MVALIYVNKIKLCFIIVLFGEYSFKFISSYIFYKTYLKLIFNFFFLGNQNIRSTNQILHLVTKLINLLPVSLCSLYWK